MKRWCFLAGVSLGLYLGLQPVLHGAKDALTRLVEADEKIKREEREHAMNQVPVSWGEGVEAHLDMTGGTF